MEQRKLQNEAGLATSQVRPADLDDDAILRMLDGPFDEGLFSDEPVRSEMMVRLFEFALKSLKQANASAERTIEESRAFHKGWRQRSAELDASQQETRRMIEDLIRGD